MADAAMYLKPKETGFGGFVWNSEKGEFCGRTGESWAKIGLFYFVFYSFLASFFGAMMAVFYQTLDTQTNPKFIFGDSLLRNPALGFRPRPRAENVESTLIWYKNGDENDIVHWVNELNNFISGYEGRNEDGQHIRECGWDTYAEEKILEAEGIPRSTQSCKFQDTELKGRDKNGELNYCHKKESWGYARESPCILLKLNKIIGWEPHVYDHIDQLPENMPKTLSDHIRTFWDNNSTLPPMAWVSCEGENPADKEYLPSIDMYPNRGFPAYFFPYHNNAAYRSPLVAVQFTKPEPNVLINIECKIWARNVKHDRQHRLGMVHFELLRD